MRCKDEKSWIFLLVYSSYETTSGCIELISGCIELISVCIKSTSLYRNDSTLYRNDRMRTTSGNIPRKPFTGDVFGA